MTAARDALLSRIIDDVAANGIGDRSLRDLAAGAGTSHRLIIYHFGSRAGLVAAIVDEIEARQRLVLRTLADETGSPVELVRAMWERLTAVDVRPFVRLFFEALSYPGGRRGGSQLTGDWLDDSERVSAMLGVPYDAVEIRLGIAVMRGLLIDVIDTGDVVAPTASMELFLARWPLAGGT